MAVTLTTLEVEYVSDGSTTEFPVPFAFEADEHLRVSVISNGVTLPLVLNVGYTVTGAGKGENAGTVTLVTATAAGNTVRIVRVVPLTQPVEFRTQGRFSPVLHEKAFDRLTMICQQLQAGVIDPGEIIAGEVNEGANLGSGAGVYADKIGAVLRFRSIVAGDETISVSAGEQTISIALGEVGPEDVGAAPAALEDVVDDLASRLSDLEMVAEAEYRWDGTAYTRVFASDPLAVLPKTIAAPVVGTATVDLTAGEAGGSPTDERYTVLVTAGPGVSSGQPMRVAYRNKSVDGFDLQFSGSDLGENVEHFCLRLRFVV